ncbi:uncharacterized protein TNIN_375611 [Trichonephila inaurata madagascariensis]|uniref:Sushi domain-containing protein n=1 Tax=Trichonephila inaurata madagascariensis TaxID=2747483 RepID=A0A8X6YAV5_9ARAC|nr:uncharacterized protein TNIN_375611 [Trichonephila inaurata madagascariensis]
MRPLIRALSFLALLLCFQVQGAYLFDEYQEYPVDYSDEKKDDSADKKPQCNEPLAPEFGKVLVVGNFLEINSRAIFTCEQGREMEGSMTSKCLDSLQWSLPPPKCVKKCSVPKVQHGRIGRPSSFLSFVRRERWSELPEGQKLEDKVLLKLRCDDKYEPLGKHTFEETVNCENGEWFPIPQCEPAKCRSKPPESANATANKVNGSHGERVMYTCIPSFRKKVQETIVCEFGQWTGLVPVCTNTSEDDGIDKAEDMSADKKVLAIINTLKKFRVNLLRQHFKTVSDCSAFQKTRHKKDLFTRIARWALRLEEFDYEMKHRDGGRMKHVDVVSRYSVII